MRRRTSDVAVRNITIKFPGTDIYHFEESLELTDGHCIANCEPGQEDCDQLLDPKKDDCNPIFRVKPFSTCKNDCPGGEYNPSSCNISILNACYCSEKFWHNWGWRLSFWSVCHCRSDYPGYSPGNRWGATVRIWNHSESWFFEDWEQQEQHWQLGQHALLPSASHGQDNVAYLVSDRGEGLSVQDRVSSSVLMIPVYWR